MKSSVLEPYLNEVIRLSEAKEREQTILDSVNRKQEQAAHKLVETERKISAIGSREKAVGEKEQQQKYKDMEIKAKEIDLRRREIRLKQITTRYGG